MCPIRLKLASKGYTYRKAQEFYRRRFSIVYPNETGRTAARGKWHLRHPEVKGEATYGLKRRSGSRRKAWSPTRSRPIPFERLRAEKG